MRRIRGAWGVWLAIIALALPVHATSIAPTTLGKLASGVDLIVVGKVLRVVEVPVVEAAGSPTVRLAEVEVLECLKGMPRPERLWYHAGGDDVDRSDAVVGETALLFLGPVEPVTLVDEDLRERSFGFRKRVRALTGDAPLWRLCWSGFGRMPVDEVEGVTYATCGAWIVRLPPDLPTIPGATPGFFDMDRRVPLEALRDFVKRRLRPLPERAAPVRKLLDELDADPDVCPSERAEMLLEAQGEDAVPVLVALLDDPAFPRRDTVAEALFLLGDPGVEALHRALASKDLARRRAAAFALEWAANTEFVDPEELMPEALEAADHPDPDPEFRARMFGAMARGGGMDDDEPVDALLIALGDESLRVRRRAARTLLQLTLRYHRGFQFEKVEAALLALASHENVDLRREVWEVLAYAAGPKSLPAAQRGLEDADRVVRVLATFALRRIRAEAATKLLVGLLASKDAWVRRTAAYSLGEAKAAEAVGALVKALADTDVDVVRCAIDALGEIGPPAKAAVPALEKLQGTTKDPALRSDIEDALEEIRK